MPSLQAHRGALGRGLSAFPVSPSHPAVTLPAVTRPHSCGSGRCHRPPSNPSVFSPSNPSSFFHCMRHEQSCQAKPFIKRNFCPSLSSSESLNAALRPGNQEIKPLFSARHFGLSQLWLPAIFPVLSLRVLGHHPHLRRAGLRAPLQTVRRKETEEERKIHV